MAYNENFDFPSNRSELYKDGIDALLRKWDSSRRIKRSDRYKNLPLRRKENLLSRIAMQTFEKDQYFLPERTLVSYISYYINDFPEVNEREVINDSEAILNSIESQHGILIQRAKGIYSFSHLTFQEYFSAKYIVDTANNNSLEKLIQNYSHIAKWREVFLLTAGLLHEADGFLLKMKEYTDSFYWGKVKIVDKLNYSCKVIYNNIDENGLLKRVVVANIVFRKLNNRLSEKKQERKKNT